MALKRTILHDWHVSNNARIVEFAGFEMPLSYTTIIKEHEAVRNSAGLFDLCHMGRLKITGLDSLDFLQYIVTNDVTNLEVEQVQYALICNTQGGVIDDVTLYRSDDFYLMVVNGINTDIVFSWLNQHRTTFTDVHVENISMTFGMIAIQGPNAEEILQQFVSEDLSAIAYYHFKVMDVAGVSALVSRTGYTGEDGFEIYLSAISIPNIWQALLEKGKSRGLVPVGLGARDTLRLEACFPLYGNELNNFTTPLEAGLGKFVHLEKEDFIGKGVLVHSTEREFTRRLVAFQMEDKSIPRKSCPLLIEKTRLGKVTSGTFSPTLQKGIGMGYVPHYQSEPNTPIEVEIHNSAHPGIIVKKPFYKRRNQT